MAAAAARRDVCDVTEFALSRAGEAFDEAGALKDVKAQQSVQHVLAAIGELATALKGGMSR